jgi:hypothetical protein
MGETRRHFTVAAGFVVLRLTRSFELAAKVPQLVGHV